MNFNHFKKNYGLKEFNKVKQNSYKNLFSTTQYYFELFFRNINFSEPEFKHLLVFYDENAILNFYHDFYNHFQNISPSFDINKAKNIILRPYTFGFLNKIVFLDSNIINPAGTQRVNPNNYNEGYFNFIMFGQSFNGSLKQSFQLIHELMHLFAFCDDNGYYRPFLLSSVPYEEIIAKEYTKWYETQNYKFSENTADLWAFPFGLFCKKNNLPMNFF